MPALQIYIPSEEFRELVKEKAKEVGLSVSDYVRKLVEEDGK